jgi:hypothetical protein
LRLETYSLLFLVLCVRFCHFTKRHLMGSRNDEKPTLC